ncbi:MAG TPA: C25 family cysteine peptidase [bacterium]
MILRALALFIVIISLLSAGVITETIEFTPADFQFSTQNGYDVVTLQGQFSTTEKGRPFLPAVTYYYLIPPTAEITSVEIISSSIQDFTGKYTPYPVQTIRPFSTNRIIPFVEPDAGVYGSAKPYPREIVEAIPSGCLSGYRLAGVMLYPVQFIPAEKKLRLYKSITLKINYTVGRHPTIPLTKSQADLFGAEVKSLVRNPETIEYWRPSEYNARAGEIDMVIITSTGQAANWNALKTWKTKKGINTAVISTDSVYAQYAGRDNQEKIRNFIRDYWQTKGLKYVILGGDDMIIPDRKTTLWVEESTIVGDIPTDMYYADLQWSWDGNHNDLFGEMEDTVDLFHDVYIGRAPVDNATNIATFTRKDTVFEKHPDTTYMKTLLLPSEMLFDPYHGKYPNNIIASYFPGTWKISRLEDPSYNQTRDSLNKGFQLCHVADHGSPWSLGVLDIEQVSTLTNGIKYDILNGMNCDCGSFDGMDCIAESLVNIPNGGCVATMLNSRYGLGYPPGLGPSEILDIEIFKSFIVAGALEFGAAHGRAKNFCRAMAMSQSPTRWCVYENTLFGDPSLAAYATKPQHMTVTYASSIQAGPQAFRVMASITGVPIKSALICAMKGTEVYATGRTNALGWVDLFVNPSTGTMNVTVTSENCLPFEGTCTVTAGSPRPCITYWAHHVNDASGNNNGRMDPGETVDLVITLKNQGNATATNVSGKLRTTCPYITFIDSTAIYGTVPAGDTSTGAGDIYRLQVSSTAPQGTEAEFIVFSQAGEGTWEPFFIDIIGTIPQPGLVWADHDTGACVLSVTTFGGFGTTYPHGEGSGFKYSKIVSNGSLYYGSMVCGTSSSYIVDRFYGPPSSSTINYDFNILDTLKPVLPPRAACEEYEAVYSDSGHASPKGLIVTQWSLMNSQPGYDDWAIVCFDYFNSGSTSITNFYSGMMFDFDLYNTTDNIVRSDTVRRFTYMMQPYSMYPTCGVRLIEPITARNLSAIDHLYYVEPATMMTEAVKDSFLKGLLQLRNSTRTDNYSICVSAGPYTITPGGNARAVYAVVGGNDSTLAKINSDSAQSWWDQHSGAVENRQAAHMRRAVLQLVQNPARHHIGIAYQLNKNETVAIDLYDATGQRRTRIFEGTLTGKGVLNWTPAHLAPGVYFVRLQQSTGDSIEKVLYLR